MAITDDIRAAIDKNLSAEIGTSLKTRLQLAEDMEKKAVLLERALNEKTKQLEEAHAKLDQHGELNRKLEALKTKEAEVDKKLLRVELYEQLQVQMAARLADMKELVKDVFANHRFKYMVTEGGTLPVQQMSGGYSSIQTAGYSRTASGEGTGAPPPPPGPVVPGT